MRHRHRQTEDLPHRLFTNIEIHRIAVKSTKLFLLLFSIPFFAFAQDGLYRQKIFVQPSNYPVLQQAVADMQMQLQSATGRPFSTTTSAELIKEGIQLLLFRPGLLSEALSQRLRNGSIEDFVIEGNANRLLLVATHPAGLCKAIYTYLDRLGIRWYLPGEDWSVVTGVRNITLVNSAFYTPSFVLRNFFGTGAIMPIKPLDPNGILVQQWEDWKRRNRFGGQFNLAGHYGETFNSRYQELLQKNPQYLAQVGGKRQWSQGAKWCISNKDFRALFVADRVNELKQVLQSS